MFLKSKFEYRFTFFSEIIMESISYVTVLFGIWILLDRFGNINGWELYEVILLYNMNIFSYGLAQLFFYAPLRELTYMVRDGSFDGILIRPMNPLLLLLASRQMYIGFLGDILVGAVVFSVCLPMLDIQWTFLKILYLVGVMLGASLIHTAVIMITCSISFWVVQSLAVRDIFIRGIRRFVDYPISIYHRSIQVLMTFVVPFAFVNFYPVQYLLGGKGEALFHPVLQYGTPLVGIVLFIVAYRFLIIGINNYQSTGS